MKTAVIEIPATRNLRTLIVDTSDDAPGPVLLYLHSRGEASQSSGELPKIAFHMSPVYMALSGAVTGVTVIAPQAPHEPDDGWNWRDYVGAIGDHIKEKYADRNVLATGFSRGGLGVLQLMDAHPGLVDRWAIVDPQRAADDAEHDALMPAANDAANGWLRFGDAIQENTPLSRNVAENLPEDNTRFVDLDHTAIAVAAFTGDRLDGPQHFYEFLGVDFDNLKFTAP